MKLLSLPCYCATLRQTARAVTAMYEEALAGSGLHATQYTALQVLSRMPNLTTTDLAGAIATLEDVIRREIADQSGVASSLQEIRALHEIEPVDRRLASIGNRIGSERRELLG